MICKLSRFFLCLSVVAVAVAVSFAWAAEEFPAGRWYKGNTHSHTFWSDGDDFPEMVADWYKSHGYDFLAISDHNILMQIEKWAPIDFGKRPVPAATLEKCQKRFGKDWLEIRDAEGHREVKLKKFDEVCNKFVEPGKFLMIQNEEITTGSGDHHSVHLNAINIAAPIVPNKSDEGVVDTLKRYFAAVEGQAKHLERPIVAQLNHPNWKDYDISAEDMAAVPAIRFFEVYNGNSAIHNGGDSIHPSTEKLWDVANTIRISTMKQPPLFCVGADDVHNYQQFAPWKENPGRAWIMVRAKQLDTESLLAAMNRGDFYASTGVILKNVAYDAEKRTFAVEVKAEPGVNYTIEFIGTLAGADTSYQTIEAPRGKNGKPRRAGRKYSPEVGKVLAKVKGTSAAYTLTGKELYVRAAVRSDKIMPNPPAGEPPLQQAWCQPVGY